MRDGWVFGMHGRDAMDGYIMDACGTGWDMMGWMGRICYIPLIYLAYNQAHVMTSRNPSRASDQLIRD